MKETEVYKKLFIATLGAAGFVFAIEVLTYEQIYTTGPLLFMIYIARVLFVEPNEVNRQNKFTIYFALWTCTFIAVQKLGDDFKTTMSFSVPFVLPWLYEYLERRRLKKERAVLDDASK